MRCALAAVHSNTPTSLSRLLTISAAPAAKRASFGMWSRVFDRRKDDAYCTSELISILFGPV